MKVSLCLARSVFLWYDYDLLYFVLSTLTYSRVLVIKYSGEDKAVHLDATKAYEGTCVKSSTWSKRQQKVWSERWAAAPSALPLQ